MSRRTGLDLRDDRLLCELLGRQPRQFAPAVETRGAGDECVMVTGAGGSVGSELVRQLAGRRPAQLVLVDHSEYALFRIEQEMRERLPEMSLQPVLADVTRPRQMRDLFDRTRPTAVFHAAAYKHVAMMERDVLSPCAPTCSAASSSPRLAAEHARQVPADFVGQGGQRAERDGREQAARRARGARRQRARPTARSSCDSGTSSPAAAASLKSCSSGFVAVRACRSRIRSRRATS